MKRRKGTGKQSFLWILLLALCLCLGGCSTEYSPGQTQEEADEEQQSEKEAAAAHKRAVRRKKKKRKRERKLAKKYINMVRNAAPQMAPQVTFGQALEGYLSDGQWQCITTTGGRRMVGFIGTHTYSGIDVVFKVWFRVNKKRTVCVLDSVYLNDEQLDEEDAESMLWDMIQKYAKKHDIYIDDGTRYDDDIYGDGESYMTYEDYLNE